MEDQEAWTTEEDERRDRILPAQPQPPPAPPLPPPLQSSTQSAQKTSRYVLKLKTAPTDWFYQPSAAPKSFDNGDAWCGKFFFYSSLMDPSLLKEILSLEDEPELRPAYVSGYQCRLWGPYPALVDGDENVHGAAYHIKMGSDVLKLAAYETKNYRLEGCRIFYSDGQPPEDEIDAVFVFDGNKRDLDEGEFDLRTYLKRMGRLAALEKLDAKTVKAVEGKQ